MKRDVSDSEALVLPLFEEALSPETLPSDLERFTEAIRLSGLRYHGDAVLCCFVPTVFGQSARRFFEDIAGRVVLISEKVTNHFIESPAYRSLWNLDALSAQLVALETGYASSIPMMRADIFLDRDSGDFRFCEINTDGTSSMNEDRCAALAVKTTELFKEIAATHPLQSQELFEPWVSRVLELYAEWSARRGLDGREPASRPRVAIVDFTEDATMQEFLEFQARFIRRGIDCELADIADLRYEKGSLLANGKPVDIVYRRAVSDAVIEDLHRQGIDDLSAIDGSDCKGSAALLSAARYNTVALIGGFRTLLAHSKQFFEILWHPDTWAVLDEEEVAFIQRRIPRTFSFTPLACAQNEVLSSKDRWILKPKNGLGTVGVFAGQNHSEDEWRGICADALEADYVLQEYCAQHAYPNIIPQKGMRSLRDLNYIVGLFIYADHFAGTYIRAGQGAILGSIRGSGVVPSFWLGHAPASAL